LLSENAEVLCESQSQLLGAFIEGGGDPREPLGSEACRVGAGGTDGWVELKPPIGIEDGYIARVLVDERGFEDDEGLRKDKSVPALDFLLICGRDSCFKQYQQTSERYFESLSTISCPLVSVLREVTAKVGVGTEVLNTAHQDSTPPIPHNTISRYIQHFIVPGVHII
jgi:hypothetical protein